MLVATVPLLSDAAGISRHYLLRGLVLFVQRRLYCPRFLSNLKDKGGIKIGASRERD